MTDAMIEHQPDDPTDSEWAEMQDEAREEAERSDDDAPEESEQ